MMVQQLQERYWENRMGCCDEILQNIPANSILLTCDEARFHLCLRQ